ncbi:MAG: hypothetical protein WCO45_02795 [Pseudanabaena sp. ELA607]|jgi:hypothetical protein
MKLNLFLPTQILPNSLISWHFGWKIATAITISITALGNAAFAIENGLYYGGRTFYIHIASRGDRICYKGTSHNGTTVASITLIKDQDNRRTYLINNFNRLGLGENTAEPRKFRFGEIDEDNNVISGGTYRLLDSVESPEIGSEMAQCLTSTEPFFWQNLTNRSRSSRSR